MQELGDALSALVRIPFLATTLAIMRGPARMAGLGDLQRFLERGFTTFQKMAKPRLFVATITERERDVLENIFRGRPDPFNV